MKKNYFLAIASLVGIIVGAGIFGIPYVISKSGIVPGLFYFLILGIASLFLYLFFGEIVLRSNDNSRLVGYARKYLGSKGKFLLTISAFVGLIGSLLAYIIIGGDFLKIVSSFLIPSTGEIPTFYFGLIFMFSLSLLIFRGMRAIAPLEILTNSLFFTILILIFCFGLSKINLPNFTIADAGNFFLPYGVILFALSGWSAIPEIVAILKGQEDRKKLKKVIIVSLALVVVIYLVFVFTVVGISGKDTTPDALSGLIPFLGPEIIFFGALAALITVADSFLIIGICMRNILVYDFKMSKGLAALITCATPLTMFLLGFQSFIGTIGFIGSVVGAIEGVVLILMFRRAKKFFDREPEYSISAPSFILFVLPLIFILGAVLQIFNW